MPSWTSKSPLDTSVDNKKESGSTDYRGTPSPNPNVQAQVDVTMDALGNVTDVVNRDMTFSRVGVGLYHFEFDQTFQPITVLYTVLTSTAMDAFPPSQLFLSFTNALTKSLTGFDVIVLDATLGALADPPILNAVVVGLRKL